jgi:hypothetical protein
MVSVAGIGKLWSKAEDGQAWPLCPKGWASAPETVHFGKTRAAGALEGPLRRKANNPEG